MLLQVPNIGQLSPNHDTDLGKSVVVEQEEKCTHNLPIYLQIFDKYCPDGLVFDEASTAFAKCSFPFSVDCKGRPDLQPAQPTKLCPRQNGYFAHEDPSVNGNFMAFATYNFLL